MWWYPCFFNGQIGSFHIISEGSISSGVRRVEAITGIEAFHYVQRLKKLNSNILKQLQVTEKQVLGKIDQLVSDKKQLEKEIEKFKQESAVKDTENLLNNFKSISNIKLITEKMNDIDGKTLRKLGFEAQRESKRLYHRFKFCCK